MVYRLHYTHGSAAMGVRALLEEIGAPYELIETTIDRSAPRPAELMALNPNGWIPVLTWDDGAMYEAAAITIFLCDRHPEAGLAPARGGSEHALFLQTLVYFSNTVQTAFQQSNYPDRFVDAPEDHASAARRGARRLREIWNVIEAQIGDRTWLLGDAFSAADIQLYMLTTWLTPAKDHPSLDALPNVRRVAAAAAERPSIRRVFAPAS